jgi:proline dehydrogenase
MIPPIASRFVAGETPAVALEHTRLTNAEGVKVILNLLGEHYDDPAPARADADTYRQLLADIDSTGLDACISVKPSQIGLDVSEDLFREQYRAIAAAGDEHDVFVWCDMEDATTTGATLDAYEDLAREFGGGMGLCVQANLRRTKTDLERLADVPGKIRLVKGAYEEDSDIAYTEKSAVNEAYREDLEFMFQEFDGGIGVGSHDPAMIDFATDLHDQYGTDFEIQMLMGVREQAQVDLAADGYEVWQYAPYGDKWLSYFYRRVREGKENLGFALRAIVSG